MSDDLIYMRNPKRTFMTRYEVFEAAPAIFQTGQADHLSNRYAQVTTADAMEVLEGYNYLPVQAVQKRSRKEGREGFQQHLISFNRIGQIGEEGIPEVLLYNSHDGSSSWKMLAGYFKFACSNGIIAGDGFQYSLRHYKSTVEGIEDLLRKTLDDLPRMMERIDRMQSHYVRPNTIQQFVNEAADLRWIDWKTANLTFGEAKPGMYWTPRTIEQLQRVRRTEDNNSQAWTVFNRVQEGLLKGKVKVAKIDEEMRVTERKPRPLSAINKQIDVNRKLWDLAEDILMEDA